MGSRAGLAWGVCGLRPAFPPGAGLADHPTPGPGSCRTALPGKLAAGSAAGRPGVDLRSAGIQMAHAAGRTGGWSGAFCFRVRRAIFAQLAIFAAWALWELGATGGADAKIIITLVLLFGNGLVFLPIIFVGGIQGLLGLSTHQKTIPYTVSITLGAAAWLVDDSRSLKTRFQKS